jgi:hypothetical protein
VAVFIDLEFDTGATGRALLGDIASSLVSLDELLRDLGSMAAYPSSAEFRKIEIVAIELRSPLKVKLSLFAIPPDAVKAFQAICRDIISRRPANIEAALALCTPDGAHARITEQEAQRMHGHIETLHNAEVPLRRIEVRED